MIQYVNPIPAGSVAVQNSVNQTVNDPHPLVLAAWAIAGLISITLTLIVLYNWLVEYIKSKRKK